MGRGEGRMSSKKQGKEQPLQASLDHGPEHQFTVPLNSKEAANLTNKRQWGVGSRGTPTHACKSVNHSGPPKVCLFCPRAIAASLTLLIYLFQTWLFLMVHSQWILPLSSISSLCKILFFHQEKKKKKRKWVCRLLSERVRDPIGKCTVTLWKIQTSQPLWESILEGTGGLENCTVCSRPEGWMTLGKKPALQGRDGSFHTGENRNDGC